MKKENVGRRGILFTSGFVLEHYRNLNFLSRETAILNAALSFWEVFRTHSKDVPAFCSLGGPCRYWWSLAFFGNPLTGIHKAACSLLQLVHPNIPSGDLISSWLNVLPGRSSAASLCILGRREEYFVSTVIKTEVWNEKFSTLFLKPWGLSYASVMMTLGPKRRPTNKPQMSGE